MLFADEEISVRAEHEALRLVYFDDDRRLGALQYDQQSLPNVLQYVGLLTLYEVYLEVGVLNGLELVFGECPRESLSALELLHQEHLVFEEEKVQSLVA